MDSIPPPRPNPLNITANHLSRAHSLLLQPPFPTPPSHSSSHSLRVHNIAIQLYSALPPCTRPKISVPLLRLLALLHDIADHKYLPSDLTASSNFLRNLFETNLRLHPLVADYIASLCDNVSYSKQVNSTAIPAGQILELDLVRDADRLDAIGATGIARCFSFGGERGHPLADQRSHFDDKLFNIPLLLHTEPARRLAKEREQVMIQFVKAFDEEMAMASQPLIPHGEDVRFEDGSAHGDL